MNAYFDWVNNANMSTCCYTQKNLIDKVIHILLSCISCASP